MEECDLVSREKRRNSIQMQRLKTKEKVIACVCDNKMKTKIKLHEKSTDISIAVSEWSLDSIRV